MSQESYAVRPAPGGPTTEAPGGAATRAARRIDARRLLAATAVAAAGSAVANTVLQQAGVRLFDIPAMFEPLAGSAPAVSSVVAAVGAAGVLAALTRFTGNPVRAFHRVSAAFLVVSFLPLVMMVVKPPPELPPAPAAGVGLLAAMHVVAFLVTVPVLARSASTGRR